MTPANVNNNFFSKKLSIYLPRKELFLKIFNDKLNKFSQIFQSTGLLTH